MAIEIRSVVTGQGTRVARWATQFCRWLVAMVLISTGPALTAGHAQSACLYSVCNPWGSPPAYSAIGRTPLSACTQGTARWISGSNIDVSLYGGYPNTEVCGGGANCCINWPAGQQNYTWLCSSCAPEVTEENTCSTANPVQPGVGRKRLQETDYTGVGPHPLTLTRYYSSNWTDGATSAGLSSTSVVDGGWRYNYQASITLRADGYPSRSRIPCAVPSRRSRAVRRRPTACHL